MNAGQQNALLKAERPEIWHIWRIINKVPHGPGFRAFMAILALGEGLLFFDPFDWIRTPPIQWINIELVGLVMIAAATGALLTFRQRLTVWGRLAAILLAATYAMCAVLFKGQFVTVWFCLWFVICCGAEAATTAEEYNP